MAVTAFDATVCCVSEPNSIKPSTVEVARLYVVLVRVIVKLGYVPLTLVAPAPVNTTVWSGALLVIVGSCEEPLP